MVTDPIADYLTRIRNAQMANHRIVEIPASNLKKRITEILYDKGYILKYKFEDNNKQGVIKIALKYDPTTKLPAIQSLERVSRCSLELSPGALSSRSCPTTSARPSSARWRSRPMTKAASSSTRAIPAHRCTSSLPER